MAKPNYKLSKNDISHFMEYGYVRIRGCFSQEKAAEWTADMWTRLGFSPTDKATWTTECTHMPGHKEESVKSFAPKAWSAICELLGGEDRVAQDSAVWDDAFIVNLGNPPVEGKMPPFPHELDGYHVDGDFFVHFLDSPEQALLVIPLFNDIGCNSGGTMILPKSVKMVAKHLYDHPQGVSPYMVPRGRKRRNPKGDFYDHVVENCREHEEMMGKTGDVILLHPFMVHSQSVNTTRIPRIITNPPVSLKQPFNFDRKDRRKYSIVEKKTLRDLGMKRLEGWKIKGGRQDVVPERLKEQMKMKQEELKRMKK